MALPKLSTPTFELTLPLSQQKVTFRPFLVKEQKILMMANEASDKESIVRAIHDVLKNCTLSKKINVDTLPLLDIEYYFLNLRARSVGEIVELHYRCHNEVDGVACGNKMDVSVNLLDIKMENMENYNDVVMIDEKVGIKFKHPDLSLIEDLKEGEEQLDLAIDIILNSIEYVFEDDSLYHANETPKDELLEFLDSLTQQQFEKVEKHFENLPVLRKKVDIKCSKCGFDHSIDVEGIESFFV